MGSGFQFRIEHESDAPALSHLRECMSQGEGVDIFRSQIRVARFRKERIGIVNSLPRLLLRGKGGINRISETRHAPAHFYAAARSKIQPAVIFRFGDRFHAVQPVQFEVGIHFYGHHSKGSLDSRNCSILRDIPVIVEGVDIISMAVVRVQAVYCHALAASSGTVGTKAENTHDRGLFIIQQEHVAIGSEGKTGILPYIIHDQETPVEAGRKSVRSHSISTVVADVISKSQGRKPALGILIVRPCDISSDLPLAVGHFPCFKPGQGQGIFFV